MDWDKVFCVVILRLFHYFVTQSVGFGHAHDHGHGGDGGHGHGGDGVHGHGGDGVHGHQDFRRVYEHQIDEGRVEELVLMESWKDYDEIYIRPGRPVVNGQSVGVVRYLDCSSYSRFNFHDVDLREALSQSNLKSPTLEFQT